MYSTFPKYSDSKQTVYVYADEGVSAESLKHSILTLQEFLIDQYDIQKINSAEVIDGRWAANASLFVIPGGADLLYGEKLDGRGNEIIKQFVQQGGNYLGICAGAYFGSGYVQFDKGNELEVLGSRELAFFPGKSIGPLLTRYSYQNNSGARAALIKIELAEIYEATLYFNGGGFFKNAKDYPNISVIANYSNIDNKELPAIIHVRFAQGCVVLSGVHFEYAPSLLDNSDKYLKKIVVELQKSDPTRLKLAKDILSKLGLIIKP